jgi:endonuclease/exonuclease/phosphatase family metal-dependent hydrolase
MKHPCKTFLANHLNSTASDAVVLVKNGRDIRPAKQSMRLPMIMMIVCSFIIQASSAQQMKVATFNLRYDNKRDTGNLWVDRAPIVSALIRFHDFDIFGTQEGLENQINDISQALPEYTRFGAGRDDGKEKGEHSAIYFKTDEFKLLKSGNFWLSETPDVPSLGWDATCCNRIASWVYLQHKKSGKKFYMFNAHFDHQGVKARKESSLLILKKMREIAAGQPAIFTGDLNGSQTSEWYLELENSDLLEDSYKQVKYPYVNNASFNSFGKARRGKEIIDHIFITKQFAASKWGILTDSYYGKFPSDHFPVVAYLTLK